MAISSKPDTLSNVSILIVSYRTGPVLFDCLSACLSQSPDTEIILVDNGNPPEVLSALQALTAQHPRLRLITGHGNIGFAAGINKAAAIATGEHLWILNPDAVPPAGTLDALLTCAAQALPPYLIGIAIQNADGTEQRGSRREILTPRLALVEGLMLHKLGFKRFNHHQSAAPNGMIRVPAISGASMFLRRADFTAIGGMDDGYFLHVEDMDFCLRFSRAGGHIYYAGHIPLPHRGGTSAASRLTVERHKMRSFARYFHLHFASSHSRLTLHAVSTIISAGLLARYILQKATRRHA